MQRTSLWLCVVIAGVIVFCQDAIGKTTYDVGVARVDITPDYPIRLSGFGFRRNESEGITQKIWAKALAIRDGTNEPTVLLCVDNVGIPDYITREVASRLEKKAKLDPTRFTITSTHTHTAPMLSNMLATLFGQPVSLDQQQRIDRYTRELTDKLEEVSLAALHDLKPSTIEFASGTVGFAINRRGGDWPKPVDHELPVLVVRDANGSIRAIYASYACHCVTLSHNKISGDWAGFAMEMIEAAHPDSVALMSIGCGADQNPSSNPVGDRVDIAEGQAKQIADEVERLLKHPLEPVQGPIATTLNRIELPFDTHPTREHFEQVAKAGEGKQDDYAGYHARMQLARLDRGERLATHIEYPIQTWRFGDSLAMVFLPGEVVVDYSIRLKRELDRNRLWINAYSNDVPCYIPSERILSEGGYEGGGAMIFYDRPTKLAAGLEQKIIDEVHRQLPDSFDAPRGTEGVAPRSPEQSLRGIRTKPDLRVELVACEPLVTSPVAIDWAADGSMWVCEMFDYPTGADGNFAPAGRVKRLTDRDGDGRYDDAAVFLENIPFPTGVTAWGKGIMVCAAPDILWAEDTDGDGKADEVEKLFSGFGTDNYQARVNSLSLGLDNWVYGANGLLGGSIESASGAVVDIRNHDFRFRPPPDVDPMEPVTGLTQQGRARDDFGRWFGCDNSRSLLHYPHEQRYLRRNPHVPAPPAIVAPPAASADYDVARVFPISRTLERYNDPQGTNRFTSACGVGIYRDTLLGEQFSGNVFTCEPVHNLVHRMILSGDVTNVIRRRADDEKDCEFLASRDNWFRPVQVRTGPDGAIYVVDMYRFLIEHPRWIPAERLAQLDVRAGADKGRIYRIVSNGKPLREVRDLTKLSATQLAEAIDSPNGVERDRVHVELLARGDGAAAPELEKLATTAPTAQVRVQVLSVLDGLGALTPAHLLAAIKDNDPKARRHALRLCEPMLRDGDAAAIAEAVLSLAEDDSSIVRHQLAYSLGEWADARAGQALAKLAARSLTDAEMRIAVLSSSTRHCRDVLAAVMSAPPDAPGRDAWIPPLVATAAASDDPQLVTAALLAVLPGDDSAVDPSHFAPLAGLLDSLELKKVSSLEHLDNPRVARVLERARIVAADPTAPDEARQAAINLLGRGGPDATELAILADIVAGASPEPLREASLKSLARLSDAAVAKALIERWSKTSPAARPQVVNLLLSRDEWAEALLKEVAKRRIQPHEISLADRVRLSSSENASLKQLASEVFPAAVASNRAELLSRYSGVASLSGDASRGAEGFAKNCAPCHAHNGVGHDVGPSLATLRGKDTDYFVKNILDPSAVVEPRFVNYVIAMNDGRTLSGVIKAETASDVTLAAGSGAAIETLPRGAIRSIRATSISMMPDGFEAAFDPQQMADLIAFLKSGSSPKQLAGNAPKLIEPDKRGDLMLPATAAEVYGESIIFESEFANIGYWSGQNDHVAWKIRIPKSAEFDVHLDYACAEGSSGNSYAIDAGGETITGVVAATGPDWSRYRQIRIGKVKLPAGEQKLVVRPVGAVRGALMDLRTIALTTPGAEPKWSAPARPAAAPPPRDELARDPAALAKLILDNSRPADARQAAVEANPQFAAELIAEMTKDLAVGTPQEYERIPWIWRVSIAAGKRNDAATIKRILDVSLPQLDQPLRDWQAVVIGGGIINGISQRDVWPRERIDEILGDDAALKDRWQRSLDLASAMADDEKVPNGTRYDALRMLGVESFEKRSEQLVRYLPKETNAELQMGAVSGLADVQSPHATAALIDALPDLTEGNRNLALDAMLRDPQRARAMLDAIDAKKIDPAIVGEERMNKLKAIAREQAEKPAGDRIAVAKNGMVVTVHPLATDVAVRVLREGGNAIDAAVAAGLMLGVVDGHNSGIGGGGFLLARLADGTVIVLDGREIAPAAATRDMFIRDGKGDTKLSQTGPLASGIPGLVAIFEHAVKQHGKKQFAELLAPAADVAEQGFVIDDRYVRRIREVATNLRKFPESKRLLLKDDGTPHDAGHLFHQPDLAKTYRGVAEHGSDYFYRGPFAKSVADWMRDNGGIITESDFANYRMKQREPLRTKYRGYTILGFPPPSSGGVHVAQILSILEHFDLHALQQSNPADRIHVVAEAMKLAFADRAHWLGDPDFVDVPRGLIDPQYAKSLAQRISMDKALTEVKHGQPPRADSDHFGKKHTTHIAVADADGNFVAITQTLNTGFGSKVIIPGTGVMLNNQMDDFSIQPGVPNAFKLIGNEANSIAPGKRPLSSMSPTIILDSQDKPIMTLGAAGGPRIITQVLCVVTNHLDLHDDLPAAMKRPRFHHQWSPPTLWIENTHDQKVLDDFKSRGHVLDVTRPSGATNAIVQKSDGTFIGVSEPRGQGKAAGH